MFPCEYIYNKLAELQRQLSHPNLHMNTGHVIQIEVPDFDPDIDKVLPISTAQRTNDPMTQGSVTPALKSAEKVIECRTPAPSYADVDTQEVDCQMQSQWKFHPNTTSKMSKAYPLNRHIQT